MTEYIDYDSDPAATAARAWLYRTKHGRTTLRKATNARCETVERMLLRAIRTGWLLRDKLERDTDEVA